MKHFDFKEPYIIATEPKNNYDISTLNPSLIKETVGHVSMATAEHSRQGQINHSVLSNHYIGYFRFYRVQFCACGFKFFLKC